MKKLATLLDRSDLEDMLAAVCRKVAGYANRLRLRSGDGYRWRWILRFELGGGEVLVALPWPNERLPAVYCSNTRIDEARLGPLLDELTQQLQQYANARR